MSGLELLHYLENQCNSLSEWKEKQVIVKKISKNLYTHIQEIVTKNGCKITWNKEKNRIIISKPQESEEDLLAGLDDLVDEDGANADWLEAKKKIQLLLKKEKKIAEKEKELKLKEKQLAKRDYKRYKLYLAVKFDDGVLYLLKNYKQLDRQTVLWQLKQLYEIAFKNPEIVADKKELILGLRTLKRIYSRDKDISEKLQIIIEKVEKSKINPSIN